jgi:hypothetical protein
MSRGEFTRKFDLEIMKDETVKSDEIGAFQEMQAAEKAAIEEQFLRIMGILEHRGLWLHDRFTDISEPDTVDFRGRRFDFPKTPRSVDVGWLEFRARLTDTSLGIILESFMGISGRFKKRYDYITFPKDNVDVERAMKFVESKIFEFAASWQV